MLWMFLASWITVGIVVPVLIGIGVGVMSMTPPDFVVAKASFTLGASVLILRMAWWLAMERPAGASQSHTVIFSVILFAAIGGIWISSLLWVDNRRSMGSMPVAVVPVAPPGGQDLAQEKLAQQKLPQPSSSQEFLTSEAAEKIADKSALKALEEYDKKLKVGRPSKAELKNAARTLSDQLRRAQKDDDDAENAIRNSYDEKIREASRANDRETASRLFSEEIAKSQQLRAALQVRFGPLRAQAINLERNMLDLLPPQPSPTSPMAIVKNHTVRILLDDGFIAGPSPLFQLADYLDMLADQLR